MPTLLEEFRGISELDRFHGVTFLHHDHKKPTRLGHIGRSLTRLGAN